MSHTRFLSGLSAGRIDRDQQWLVAGWTVSEIEVVVDGRQNPDTAELIVVKQKLVSTGELHPSGPPTERHLGPPPRNGPEPERNGVGVLIHRRAQPLFDTLVEAERAAVLAAVDLLRRLDRDRWASEDVQSLEGIPNTYAVRATPDLSVIVSPTENSGVEIVDIVREAALDQFDQTDDGASEDR
jgi:hypothetical protein